MSKDYYAILGADRNATADELRKLYRQKSKQFHPDMQSGKTDAEKKVAEEKFKDVAEAYSVLGDKEKRERYDLYGDAGDNAGGFQEFGGFDPFDMFERMRQSGAFGSHHDGGFGMFGDFDDFGDCQSSRSKTDFQAPKNGVDIQTKISVTLKEAVFGCKREFDLTLDEECSTCGGTGLKKDSKPVKCKHCNGTGHHVEIRKMGPMMSRIVSPCQHCGGTGYSVEHCSSCGGTGRIPAKRHISVKIPRGIVSGTRLRVKECGQCGVNGGVNGNLFIIVDVAESDDVYSRVGPRGLMASLYISPVTATLGGDAVVQTPYGEKTVSVKSGSKSGDHIIVKGAGIKTDDGVCGDLTVVIDIEPYSNISAEQKSLLEKLKSLETSANMNRAVSYTKRAMKFRS